LFFRNSMILAQVLVPQETVYLTRKKAGRLLKRRSRTMPICSVVMSILRTKPTIPWIQNLWSS
jgi:hypothetical protein